MGLPDVLTIVLIFKRQSLKCIGNLIPYMYYKFVW